jgi:valyl-tRNA synthetase
MNPNQSPSSYDPNQSESKWQEFWEQEGIYKFNPKSQNPIYSIDTPPPTVSGKLHIGHIFSYTQAEVVARFKRMQGYNVFYPFGFDDNGLPTERLVEKEIGKKGNEMDRQEFIKICLEITAKYRERFKALWKKVGLSADWDLEYSTISPEVQKISQTSFLKLLQDGAIMKANAPALWCTECKTSVAQAEVEDKEMPTQFHTIQFKTESGHNIPIATTRPELLPACVAVFIHPDDRKYIELKGQQIYTPLGDLVPVISDDKVNKDKGTGVVMCCTYGDETDMYWVKKYNLPEKIIMDKSGRIASQENDQQRLSTKKSREEMVKVLTETGHLVSSESLQHSVGVHERCGTPIEILPVPAWFINILPLKEKFLSNADQITWHPEYMKTRYIQWVENLKWNWCISRQRFFGIPIPIWYSKKTGEIIIPTEDELPIDPQSQTPKKLPPNHTPDDIEPDLDVLDTWATSSLTPQINGRWEQSNDMMKDLYPFDLRPQAHDIIRTWAFYTIVKSELHNASIPWKDIMISGHVLSGKGEKISKSKTNSKMDPDELLAQYSADAVRYWACGAALGKNVAFDEKEIQNGKKLVNKIWNVANFVSQNLNDFDQNNILENADQLEASDKCILIKIDELSKKMTSLLGNLEVGLALGEFEKFFLRDFCDNYIEIVKDRVYNPNKYELGDQKKISAQTTLFKSFNTLLKLVAPFLPYVTEEIYQRMFSNSDKMKSIHISQYPISNSGLQLSETDTTNLYEGMDLFQKIILGVRKFKAESRLRLGEEIEKVEITGSQEQLDRLRPFADDILGVTKSRNITFLLSNDGQFKFSFTQ